LEQIDYEWVEKQQKIINLKKALNLLEKDGGYFPDLENAIKDKMKKLDPSKYTKAADLTEKELNEINKDVSKFITKTNKEEKEVLELTKSLKNMDDNVFNDDKETVKKSHHNSE
jgi:Skp family chaperone for outer membrane proteins